MFKKSLLVLSLSSMAFAAHAHQVWLERDASGAARVYVGDADDAHDAGEEVAKLAPNTKVFTTDAKTPVALTVKNDHLEAAVSGQGDVRAINDQMWKPWKNKDGQLQAAVFNARAGRADTKAALDYELVPVTANGSSFVVTYKGQPLADKRVTVVNPEKWTKTFKADKAGRIDVPVKAKGRYVLISNHDVVAEQEVAGEKVQKVSYTTTLSFVAP